MLRWNVAILVIDVLELIKEVRDNSFIKIICPFWIKFGWFCCDKLRIAGLQVCTTSSFLGGNWRDLKHGLVLRDDQMASPRQLIVPSTQVRLPQTLEKWCVVWEQPPSLACELLSSGQQVLCMRPKHYSRTPIVQIKHVTNIFVPCSSSKR